MQKFENMDLIAALEAIMHQNTAYYQSDFAYDIKMLREAARSDQKKKNFFFFPSPWDNFVFGEEKKSFRMFRKIKVGVFLKKKTQTPPVFLRTLLWTANCSL